MIDAQTFNVYSAECQHLTGTVCTRPCQSYEVARELCTYNSCGILKPVVRAMADGGYAVSLVEEPGRTAVVEGPFEHEFQAKDALKKYLKRSDAIAAVMARRS